MNFLLVTGQFLVICAALAAVFASSLSGLQLADTPSAAA
jgi:hypothetical protein